MNHKDPVPQPTKEQQNDPSCIPCTYRETVVKIPHPSPKELHAAFEWTRNQALAGSMEAGHVVMELVRLKTIERTAAELNDWLHQNTGMTEDWPISITSDNIESASKMVSLLEALRSAVKESQQNTQ